MRRPMLALALLAAATLLPAPAQGQFFIGGHGSFTDYQGGGGGGGIRAGLDLPVLPLDIMGATDWFSMTCDEGQDGCSLWGATLDVNLRLPIPIVRPYLTGGLSYRSAKQGGELGDLSGTGANIGVGVDVNIVVRLFLDWRYEFFSEDEKALEGSVARLGINFKL